MGAASVTTLTCAAAGAGKSYVRCARFMVDDFLLNEDGLHISNFPVNIWPMANAVAKKRKCEVADVGRRIIIIPDDMLKGWMHATKEDKREKDEKGNPIKGEAEWSSKGPWELEEWLESLGYESPLDGAHIAIDEVHNYCGQKHPAHHRRNWMEFLGEIRHRGATFEAISQDKEKIAEEVRKESAVRYEMVNSATKRDPWFGIVLKDWYELKALITGQYTSAVWVHELRRVNSRWVNECKWVYWLDPYYFQFYNSFNKPERGGKAKATKFLPEFKKRGRLGLLWWFVRRNSFRLSSRFALVALVMWMCFFGGATLLLEGFLGFTSSIATAQGETPGKGQSGGDGNEKVAPAEKANSPGKTQGKPDTTQTKQSAVDAKREVEVRKRETDLKVQQAEAENRRLEEQTRRLQQALKKKQEEDRQRQEVALIAPDGVVVRDGSSYELNERIEYGTFEGYTVAKIDYKRRTVVLTAKDHGGDRDDNPLAHGERVILRLGGVRGGADPEPDGSNVSGRIQPDVGTDGKRGPTTGGGSQGHAVGGKHEPSEVRPIPGGQSEDQRRGGTETRQ